MLWISCIFQAGNCLSRRLGADDNCPATLVWIVRFRLFFDPTFGSATQTTTIGAKVAATKMARPEIWIEKSKAE